MRVNLVYFDHTKKAYFSVGFERKYALTLLDYIDQITCDWNLVEYAQLKADLQPLDACLILEMQARFPNCWESFIDGTEVFETMVLSDVNSIAGWGIEAICIDEDYIRFKLYDLNVYPRVSTLTPCLSKQELRAIANTQPLPQE